MNPKHADRGAEIPHAPARAYSAAILPLALGLVIASACWVAAGISLGLFLGPFPLAIALAPPIALAQTESLRRILAGGAVVDGIGLVWLVAAIGADDVTIVQWLLAYLTLLAVVAGFVGLAAGLARIGLNRVIASMVAVIVGLAWHSSPIWLMPRLTDRVIDKLIAVHPIFALNGILADLGIWTQHDLAYHLTSLGQDVPYTLPDSPLACIILHLMICTAGWLMARDRSRVMSDERRDR